MKQESTGIKILNTVAILAGFTGMLMAVKIPGTLALAPLAVALLIGIFTVIKTKKQGVRCSGCYLGVSLAIIGILLTVFMELTTEPEVAVDKNFEQKTEKAAQEAEKELDELLEDTDLNNLLNEEDLEEIDEELEELEGLIEELE